jgi:hypothetical protein
MELANQNNQLAAKSAPATYSAALMTCLIKMETTERAEAKMDLMQRTAELMPAGKPNFPAVVQYPRISTLVEQYGRKRMLAVIVLLVKDFCASVNCVRNMNEDQMLEAGLMLLNECGNFRLEDYVMMFDMAKKGKLDEVKIMDRLDIQVISKILDVYWLIRKRAGDQEQDKDYSQLEEKLSESAIARLTNPVWNGKEYVEGKKEDHESVEALQLRLDTIAQAAGKQDEAK